MYKSPDKIPIATRIEIWGCNRNRAEKPGDMCVRPPVRAQMN